MKKINKLYLAFAWMAFVGLVLLALIVWLSILDSSFLFVMICCLLLFVLIWLTAWACVVIEEYYAKKN